MKISMLGCGYVGAVTGAGFCELGKEVIFVDIDPAKVNAIASGRSPIYEPGLDELIAKNISTIYATTDTKQAVLETDITFIAVGTPSKPDGSIDFTYIESACRAIGYALKEKEEMHIIVVKSTVLSGTTEGIIRKTLEEASGKTAHSDFGLASNPEFLREGSALSDFFNPDRIIIGVADDASRMALDALYSSFDCPKLYTEIPVAEMIKYVSNAFLATKISFSNEIGNLCKKIGIDAGEVFRGVGMDSRINPAFFNCGIGFGGSCFPKDVRTLIKQAEGYGIQTRILHNVISVNEDQPLRVIDLLKRHIYDLNGKTIGILGLSFKPNTDDIRESRAIPIVDELLRVGAIIIAYDPLATEAFRRLYPQITYPDSAEDVIKSSEAIIIVTEWIKFKSLDYTGKLVIDGRRIHEAKIGSIYEGVCW